MLLTSGRVQLGGRERRLASAYQTMSKTMELIMQKAAPKVETVTLKDLAAKLAETHEPAQERR